MIGAQEEIEQMRSVFVRPVKGLAFRLLVFGVIILIVLMGMAAFAPVFAIPPPDWDPTDPQDKEVCVDVALTQPGPGQVVYTNNFTLQGSIFSKEPPYDVTLTITRPDGSQESRDLLNERKIKADGSFNETFPGLLLKGDNYITVTALTTEPPGEKCIGGPISQETRVLSFTPYEGPKGDIIPTGLEVTQVIQDLANSVPLIAGKTTYARLYVKHSISLPLGFTVPGTDASLILSRGTGESVTLVPINRGKVNAYNNGGNRAVANDSFIFRIPPAWTTGEVTIKAEVFPPPGLEVDASSKTNNTLSRTLSFVASPKLAVDFVRLHLHPNTYSISDDWTNFLQIVRRMVKVYPIAEDRLLWLKGGTISPWGHVSTPFGDVGPEWELPNGTTLGIQDYDLVASRLWSYNLWTDDPDGYDKTIYYGMADTRSRKGVGGFDGSGYTGGDESWGFMDSTPQGLGPLGGETLAHEIGHNFGRNHINDPPGVPAGPYDSYTYPPGSFGAWGTATPPTIYGFDVDTQTPIAPWTAGDMMSYASPRWTSDFTYSRMYYTGLEKIIVPPPQGEFLTATGFINTANNTAMLETFYRVMNPKSSLVSRSGQILSNDTYDLVLLGAGGQVLYTHTFSPNVSRHSGESPFVSFSEILPYDSRAARIVLRRGNVELASRLVSTHSPEVTVLSPNGGEAWGNMATISWAGRDADGDDLRYTVQYSADGGQKWRPLVIDFTGQSFELDTTEVPGSPQALIRVIASDGVNTGMDTSDGPFAVPPKPPTVVIASPVAGAVFTVGDPVLLTGYVFDLEGDIFPEDALFWASDRDGFLGKGSQLLVQGLSPGAHRFTLTAIDKDGNRFTSPGAQVTVRPPQSVVPVPAFSPWAALATILALGGCIVWLLTRRRTISAV